MNKTVFLLLISLVCCQSKPEQSLSKTKDPIKQLQSELDSLFSAKIGKDEPGAALMVSYKGKLIVGKGYGLRDLESKEPITATTNMRMGSVTKQFTALAVLHLVDQGKLSLSDLVTDFFPSETFKGITVEQLINHTSGLEDAEEAFFSEWDTSRIATNKDILEWYLKENRKIDEPGEKYVYNNGVYEFIPSIVEKVSGQDFAQFSKDSILEKAGMKRSNIFNLAKPVDIDEQAFCYEKDRTGTWQKVDGHYLNGLLGAGGLYTNVNDYFQYDLTLRNNALFSEETHKTIVTPSSNYTEDGTKYSYAMGWVVTDSTASHSGGWFGTNTFTKRYLNTPLSYAIFMNRTTLFSSGLAQQTEAIIEGFLKSESNKAN